MVEMMLKYCNTLDIMLKQNAHYSAIDVTPSLTDDKVNLNYCYLMNLFRCMYSLIAFIRASEQIYWL